MPRPEFEQRGDQFVLTIWRNWLTDALMTELGLNERQKKVLVHVKGEGQINHTDYQTIASTTKKAATTRDLDVLVTSGVLRKFGKAGRIYYALGRKEDIRWTEKRSMRVYGVPKKRRSIRKITRPPLRIFLCHSRVDKPVVRNLYRRLRDEGFDPWLDEEDLIPGQKWKEEIPKAVRNADVVVVCLSRVSISKAGYMNKEIKYALDVAEEQPEGRIFLIPLKLEECIVPDRLSDWQWVNLFEEQGYRNLLRALRKRAEATDAKL